MMAGMFFLLHVVVPHHHHTDEQSVEEHRHIVEHNKGMHDEKEENEEHHQHKESIIEEIIISSATIVQKTVWQFHADAIALPADFITIPKPAVVSVCNMSEATAAVFIPDKYSAADGLRAPPCFNSAA